MIIYVDIDGTICTAEKNYHNAKPIKERIEKLNKMFDEGHQIVYWTARGSTTGMDWKSTTLGQLESWGIKYSNVVFKKPYYDLYIDDKSEAADIFFAKEDYKSETNTYDDSTRKP